LFNEYFGNLRICIPTLLKFVLEHRESNSLHDGNQGRATGQGHRVNFGCCGQAFTNEYVLGHCAPKSTYGLDVFNKIKD